MPNTTYRLQSSNFGYTLQSRKKANTIRIVNQGIDRPVAAASSVSRFTIKTPMINKVTVRQKICDNTLDLVSPFCTLFCIANGIAIPIANKKPGKIVSEKPNISSSLAAWNNQWGTSFNPGISFTKSIKNIVSARNISNDSMRVLCAIFIFDRLTMSQNYKKIIKKALSEPNRIGPNIIFPADYLKGIYCTNASIAS